MENKSLLNNYILIATVFLVFYPLKGLINLSYYFFQFEANPGFFNKFVFVLLVTSLSILLLYKKFEINKYGLHLLLTFLAIALTIINGDYILLNQVFLLMVTPILFSVLDNVSSRYTEKVLNSFFKFVLIYLFIEYILLNINIDGVALISKDIYQTFYSIITQRGQVIDDRIPGTIGTFRSGGFLADPLAMPVLVLMSTIYFYVNYRLYKKYILYAIIGCFLVISSISTTAIIALLFTIIVFELNQKGYKDKIVMFFVICTLIMFHPNIDYIVWRISELIINEESYHEIFFNYNFMYDKQTYLYLLLGSWEWYGNGPSSHVDILLIPFSMGIIGFYVMYKIFIQGIIIYRNKKSVYAVYSYILLAAFICLYHHAMTLNLNVMMIVVFISNKINNTLAFKNYFVVKRKSS